MGKNNKCPNCKEKVKRTYNFCPSCGIQLRDLNQDWGMLGKSDNQPNFMQPNMMGAVPGGLLNKMLGGAMKMLEKELNNNMPNAKMKIMVNGKEINPGQPNQNQIKKEKPKNLPIEFSEENLKKWAESKKEEPKTNLKRVGDKIQYELEVPGVNTIKDISIIKLEKSLEVKALAKKTAYQKIIQIDMPLKKYSLLKGKLTLELDASM